MRKFYLSGILLFSSYLLSGQVSITAGSPSFTIDFSNSTPTTAGSNPSTAYAGAGFEPNTTTSGRLNSNAWAASGWSNGNMAFGTNQITAATDYTRGSTAVSVTTGGFYAFTGSPASVANPSFMIQPGGSDFAPGTLTLRIQNNGTVAITDLAVSYNIYVRNDQGRSSSFNFSYSTDNITYTPVAALDYTSTTTADALGWVIVGSAPSRSTVLSGVNVAVGSFIYIRWSSDDVAGTGSRDEFGLDDITCTATFAAPNTITTGTVSGPPFSLANCTSTAPGTVDFTSTDVFNAPNVFTAQLSDAAGSFASPVSIGTLALAGNGPPGTISITIPAGTPGGVGYKIRVVSSDPAVTGSESAAFTIVQFGGSCTSSATDYFRSVATGNWGAASTWESSSDNSTWIPATLTPTASANTITIRNGHVVTVAAAASADQVVVQNGGTLTHSLGVFTIQDDASGNDVDVQSGGTFILATNSLSPTFAGSATLIVRTGGLLQVSGTGLTGAGVGVNANNYVYEHQSVLEYTLNLNFAASGVTFFPNAVDGVNPIFRVSNPSSALTVGGGGNTIINGVFESNGAGITWGGLGTKRFRNGITGSGVVSDVAGSGDWEITGATASLGGTGNINLSSVTLSIGTGTIVTMTSAKTVNGTITLLANSYINLGNFNLTSNGTLTGGSTNYIRTNGTGALVAAGISTSRAIPVGNSTYNPLTISNTSGHDWTIRVEDVLTVDDPVFASNTSKAVLREWHITPSVNPPLTGADITFQWDESVVGQTGASYSQLENVQVWHEVNNGNPWGNDWIAAGVSQVAGGTPGGVRTAVITNWSWYSPFAISNISGPLPLKLISFDVLKMNTGTARLWWEMAGCCLPGARFEIEKSADGRNFSYLATVNGSTTARLYSATDAIGQSGAVYYRLKLIDADGKTTYSRVVALVMDQDGIVLTTVYPNPVQDNLSVTISTAKPATVNLELVSLSGIVVKRWTANLREGVNTIQADTRSLASGIYYLRAGGNGKSAVVQVVKQ